jgi:hypothetical protein
MRMIWNATVVFASSVWLLVSPSVQTSSAHAQATADPSALCERVADIRHMPMKANVTTDDPVYNALVAAGPTVIGCLIDKVADTTPMAEPQRIPGPTDTRVGDVAFFVLARIAGFDIAAVLPESVQREFRTQGVFAYHKFVQDTRNRRWLQARLRDWHETERLK